MRGALHKTAKCARRVAAYAQLAGLQSGASTAAARRFPQAIAAGRRDFTFDAFCGGLGSTGRFFLAMGQRYWLMKSEPDECSIDDALAAKNSVVPWTGVRNYQARNYMRDQMQIGDGVLFYHSSCAEPGIAGIAEVARSAYTDATQFERKSRYFDAKSKRDAPRWVHVDVRALRKTRLISLAELRAESALADMVILRRGNRLSITPVTAAEWQFITTRLVRAR